MLNSRLFGFWNDLGAALKTGKPQNEVKHGRKSIFEELYSDLRPNWDEFLGAMTGFPAPNFPAARGHVRFFVIPAVLRRWRRPGAALRIVAPRRPHLTLTSASTCRRSHRGQKQIKAAGMPGANQGGRGRFFRG